MNGNEIKRSAMSKVFKLTLRSKLFHQRMKVLIKNARIFSPKSPLHLASRDLLIEHGFIQSIEKNIDQSSSDHVINLPNLHVSIGWVDCFANFCDPGFEYRETLTSGGLAAAAGGFTDVMLVPNTHPVVDNKSMVEYLLHGGKNSPINIHPIGAITKKIEGKELAELYDMHRTGAVAFSDGMESIQSSGILQKALQYILNTNSTIIQFPNDKSIGTHGLMNEGIISTQLGLPGIPPLAEELMLLRDIELLRYTHSKIHFTGISTSKSVEIIAAAKAEGLNVSCSVSPAHLYFTEKDLQTYDTHLKLNPPLRTEKDRIALINGLNNGTIDFIASHHQPQHSDHKICEFEYARYGMESLECVFGAACSKSVAWEDFVQMQTINIRKIFNLEPLTIEPGAKACLTLFKPNEYFTFSKDDIFSKSHNNPWIHHQLKGVVVGIYNKERLHLRHELIHQN